MDAGAAAIAAAAIGVAGTLLAQAVSTRERDRADVRARSERERESLRAERERLLSRREEFLFRALEHFGGRTQERSVGIAIAEAYWRSVPEQIDVLVPVLLNQLVYLLSVVDTVKSADAAHERQNVRRIVELLAEIDQIDRFRDAYASSLVSIRQRQEGRGIDLSDTPDIERKVSEYLDQWSATLGSTSDR